MKNVKRFALTALCAGILALCQAAQADVIKISTDASNNPSDDPFNSIGGNPASGFGWLEGEILSWNNHQNNPVLPDPTTFHTRWEDLNGDAPTIPVELGDYVIAHYGVGPGGATGTGGGLVAYYVTVGGSLTLPDNGEGPNGFGGISFIDLWDHTSTKTPDGGATALLLGGSISALALLRRKLS